MKMHTFEVRVVETIQKTIEPYDRGRTKEDLGTFIVSIQTDRNAAAPSRKAIESVFRTLIAEVAERVGAE